MDKEIRRRLMREDEREERELQRFFADSVAADMIGSLPGAVTPVQQNQGDFKTPAQRQQEAGQMAAHQMHYNQNPDPRQGGR
jgi:hypothetical protein